MKTSIISKVPYLFHWPEDEYITPETIDAFSLKDAKEKAIASLKGWSKDPLRYVDYVQNLETGKKHYTFRGVRRIMFAVIAYCFVILLVAGVIYCLTDKPRTHRYDLYYSIAGQVQPVERIKATLVWEYPESIKWVNDNAPEFKGTSMTELSSIEGIDKGYKLVDLSKKEAK